MNYEKYLITERDIATLDIEKCANFKGVEKSKCRLKQYDLYLKRLDDAYRTAKSDIERKAIDASRKWAKKVMFNLRTQLQADQKKKRDE